MFPLATLYCGLTHVYMVISQRQALPSRRDKIKYAKGQGFRLERGGLEGEQVVNSLIFYILCTYELSFRHTLTMELLTKLVLFLYSPASKKYNLYTIYTIYTTLGVSVRFMGLLKYEEEKEEKEENSHLLH